MKFKLKYIFGGARLVLLKVAYGKRINLKTCYQFISKRVEVDIATNSRFIVGNKNYFCSNCYIGVHNNGIFRIEDNNFFNRNIHIECLERITIGSNNLFGPNVIIVDHDHRFDANDELICKQGFITEPIVIGSNVWIGGNVIICKGVTICDGVVVGANSVVTSSISTPGVYVGIPAKLQRLR